ncbi:tRNA (adenosine(37)-N6)-threonylcarbamoyltransferase complex dimerization subunit type 1 TsaB [Candidatus Dependentiae bacterium]|nr:tRNA (adenosine(37)-N6)-threonylcarbamoyltransferase complex dimerization subunit type 1 TsaB [Candidatus Dependentiae bacterium]
MPAQMTSDLFFVSIQATYQSLEIALFKNHTCVASVLRSDARASSFLVPLLHDLLRANNLSLEQCAFMVVDAGPGAFTSLRVVIATINGIAFASTMPLITVSSFEGFVQQIKQERVLVVLNAYNNDVYFAYAEHGKIVLSGSGKYDTLPTLLAAFKTDACVTVTGNGLLTYPGLMPVVFQAFSNTEVVDSGVPLAESIGQVGLQKWQRGETVKKIEPLYLKTIMYDIQRPRGPK